MLIPADKWNELWDAVPDGNEDRDEASDQVISFLCEHDLIPGDESSEDEPILQLQAAMEIGFLLGKRAYDISQ